MENEDEPSRFVWKRNPNYDVSLVSEVESRNPYAFKNPKPTWIAIAKVLQEGPLKMKVTDRSCRERVQELLKKHRKNELASIRASGISEEEMSVMKISLTSVAKLQEAKPDKQLKALYSREDRAAAELIRSTDLEKVDDSDSSIEENRKMRKRKSKKSAEEEEEDFEFDSKKVRSGARSGPYNPKKKLVNFLEKKSEEEITLRKQELVIREKEAENKAKEMELTRLKVEAEIEERKKVNELLVKLATNAHSQ